MPLTLDTRHHEVAFVLAKQVRLLTAEILCRWLELKDRAVAQFMQPLVEAKLVVSKRIRAKLIGPLSGPLARWNPGGVMPSAGRISYRAKKRYREAQQQSVLTYLATTRLLDRFGIARRDEFKAEQADHDIGVTEMWWFAFRRWPLLTAKCFEGEDCYAAERVRYEKVEDARFVHRRSGEPFTVFEFAGSYRKDRVQAFQQDMVERELPFWLF